MDFTRINALEKQLQLPLPGPDVQYRMGMRGRRALVENGGVPDNHRKAAVLNLLHFEDGVWRTVLMRRTENPQDKHSGQVSFPGGSMEESDGQDLARTALREAEEEIGVPSEKIRLLGALTELYIPVSNFFVQPYVGLLLEKVDFIPQLSEAVEILQPDLGIFSNPENQKQKDLKIANRYEVKDVPYFDVDGNVVWGATAMILAEFMELWQKT